MDKDRMIRPRQQLFVGAVNLPEICRFAAQIGMMDFHLTAIGAFDDPVEVTGCEIDFLCPDNSALTPSPPVF